MGLDKKIVVLCTSRIYDPQVHGYIEKLNERLKEKNCALMIFTINSDLYWDDSKISSETSVFDIIPYDVADAVIIMDEKIKSHTIAEKIICSAKEFDKPVIIVDGHYEGLRHVNFDYGAGFEKVVRHVMEQRRIKKPHIMAGIPDNPFSDERIAIFKKVISEYGFEFKDSMLSYGQFWAMPAREETEKLIESGNIPDAIICANDIMAINVCDVLRLHGYKIPDDILVSGFDGYDEVFITTPKITTVSCTTPDLADATADAVIGIVNGSSEEVGDVSVVPVLIPNESTDCTPKSGYDHFMLNRFNNMFYRHHDATRVMYEISTKMQMSQTPNEMVSYLDQLIVNDQNIIMDVSFVLNKKLFDIDDYFFDHSIEDIDISDYSVVYDAKVSPTLVEKNVEETLLRPDYEGFRSKVQSGYPLIFNTIDYMNVPLGYICYNYKDYDITKYSRTANVTSTLGMGIGGFINMRYQKSLSNKVSDMYKKDALTGLYNRMGFSTAFEKIKKSKRYWGKPITIIMTDLDGLKYINDNFGHAEGDNAICILADALQKACPKKALCVRFGGDEIFSVIMGECDTEKIIARVDKILDEYNRDSDKEYSVNASCGGNTDVFEKGFDFKNAIKIADEQMYNIKKEHRKSS